MHGDSQVDGDEALPTAQDAAPAEASAPGEAPEGVAPQGEERVAEPPPDALAEEASRTGIFPDETPRGEVGSEAGAPGTATSRQVDVLEVGPDADTEETLGEALAEVPEAEAPSVEQGSPPVPPRPPVRVSLPAVEARRRGHVAPAALSLASIDEDATFRVRPEGDLSGLATDIARLGQLFPVDVRQVGEGRYQLICGFRRVAALRFLQRDVVLARLHTDLSDEDALLMAVAAAVHAAPVSADELSELRDRLDAEGRLSAAARDMFEKALATESSLAPEGVEEEIDADELAADVAQRLGALNQDLSLLADVFAALDESRRAELLMQLRYSAELVAYLENL